MSTSPGTTPTGPARSTQADWRAEVALPLGLWALATILLAASFAASWWVGALVNVLTLALAVLMWRSFPTWLVVVVHAVLCAISVVANASPFFEFAALLSMAVMLGASEAAQQVWYGEFAAETGGTPIPIDRRSASTVAGLAAMAGIVVYTCGELDVGWATGVAILIVGVIAVFVEVTRARDEDRADADTSE